MLVSKYAKDDVVSFKLVNGDEVIAKIVSESDHDFEVSKPCTVMPSAQGLGLIQSLFTGEITKNVLLDKKHVMFHSRTNKKIEDHYIQTTTGIQPVSQGGIIS